jgi:hypothetical protein
MTVQRSVAKSFQTCEPLSFSVLFLLLYFLKAAHTRLGAGWIKPHCTEKSYGKERLVNTMIPHLRFKKKTR